MSTVTSPARLAVPTRKAAPADLPALSQTLAEAFFADPLFTWWIADDHRRRQILPAFFGVITEATFSGDELHTADDAVGAAVWLPPGGQPSADDMAELAPKLEQATEEFAGVLFDVLGHMDEKHPSEPHYYLFLLGTRPAWQSRGIGSALLKTVLDRADHEGMPAYLEASCERNRNLYLRHGFTVTEEVRFRDAPPWWSMWREPSLG